MKKRFLKNGLILSTLSLNVVGCATFNTTYSTLNEPATPLANAETLPQNDSEFDIPESLGTPTSFADIEDPQSVPNPFASTQSDAADTSMQKPAMQELGMQKPVDETEAIEHVVARFNAVENGLADDSDFEAQSFETASVVQSSQGAAVTTEDDRESDLKAFTAFANAQSASNSKTSQFVADSKDADPPQWTHASESAVNVTHNFATVNDLPVAPKSETVSQAHFEQLTSVKDRSTAHDLVTQSVRLTRHATANGTFHAAEPRLPSMNAQACDPNCPPQASHQPAVVTAESPLAQAYPDEYICDGGDSGYPVHYVSGDIAGLETEDTVVEYKDSEGRKRLKPTNKVCVYAPRFGSIRTIEGLGVGVKVDQAVGAREIAMLNTINERKATDSAIAQLPASGFEMSAGASGLDTKQPLFESTAARRANQNRKVDHRIEAEVRTGLNTLQMSQVAHLKLKINGPQTSAHQTQFGQEVSTSAATQVFATYKLQSVVGSEERGRPGEVQVAKTANPLSAKSGDVVTFQLHFRNIGDRTVTEVSLLDNLTPRLEYIPNSAEISVSNGGEGELLVLPNKEGSQLLNFKLDRPLRGGDSGYVTFQAKVL